jgi:ankyrin repeat protein
MVPMPTSTNRSARISGYNTNNSNTNYIRNNGTIADQLKRAIIGKNLASVKTLVQKLKRDESKKKFDYRIPASVRWLRDTVALGTPRDTDQYTILHIAASKGYTSIVRTILDSKPHLLNVQSRNGFTPLQYAVFFNCERTVKYLVERKASLKGALAYAVLLNNRNMVETLINGGANVNEKMYKHDTTPMFFAKSIDMIRTLTRLGANINQKDEYGWTPVMTYVSNSMKLSKFESFLPSLDVVKTFIDQGASVSLRGRNRDPREYEKKITLLHAVFSGTYKTWSQEIYKFIRDTRIRERKIQNPKTTLGNTPLLYLLKKYKDSIGKRNSIESREIGMSSLVLFTMVSVLLDNGIRSSLAERDIDGKSVLEHIRNLSSRVSIPGYFRNRVGLSNANLRKINNIHIPNNLNRTDPILFNTININNAYILKPDLINKTINKNGRTIRVREVKTIYNKSSLNGMIAAGRSLISPITRHRFTRDDILKLKDVAPANEMNRYKRNRR